jgi:hypothetical protein
MMTLPTAMMAPTVMLPLVLLFLAAANAKSPTGPLNLTLYRVSPLAYPGLIDMDTGDPAGDIGFGLWELLMPMQCRPVPGSSSSHHHMSIGCENGTGHYIHPGAPTNVYEQFVVETNPLLGTYHNCNPLPFGGPDAGVFNCDSMDFGDGHCVCPGAGNSEVEFQLWDEDCFNGTVYKHVHGNGKLCQSKCAQDGECAGFAMRDGMNGTNCWLLKEPLIQWDGGAEKSNCRAGQKSINSLDVPSEDCACYKYNHLAVGWQSQSGQGGGIPGMPCTAASTRQQCDHMDSCGWVSHDDKSQTDGACYSFTCSNHTSEKDCGHDDWDCAWNATGLDGTAYCGTFSCSNQSTPAMCHNNSDRDCSWNNVTDSCGGGWHHGPGGGGSPQMMAYSWRDTVQGLMAGHWYSTQKLGHCNASSASEGEAAEGEEDGCGWRVAEVKKVVNANCVNDQIVNAVLQRNASCFAKLANASDHTTDAWTTCMFEGLLGDRASGKPALAGGMLDTFPQVAELRQKILDLWVGAFQSDEPASGGCPPVPSKNEPDPPNTASPFGVKKLSLFVRDTDTADDMTNRNSADSKAMVLSAIYTAARTHLCGAAASDGATAACEELPQSIFAGAFTGGVVTTVAVEVNTFFGQFGACKKDANDNAWHCEADWECWCDHYDNNNGNGNPNPCLQGGDDGDPCMCDIWGGCGGGQWDGCPDGGCPAVADNALTVGRHSLKTQSVELKHAALASALRGLAADAHEFSTTAGGRCSEEEDEGEEKETKRSPKDSVAAFMGADDSPFSDVCTWSPVSAAHTWQSADANCLEAAMLSAAEAAAGHCLAAAGAQAEVQRGTTDWLGCVTGGEAVEAAERALVDAFDRATCGM